MINMEMKEEYEPNWARNFRLILIASLLFLLGYGVCFLCTIVNQDYSMPEIEEYINVNKVRYNPYTKEVIVYKESETIILR